MSKFSEGPRCRVVFQGLQNCLQAASSFRELLSLTWRWEERSFSTAIIYQLSPFPLLFNLLVLKIGKRAVFSQTICFPSLAMQFKTSQSIPEREVKAEGRLWGKKRQKESVCKIVPLLMSFAWKLKLAVVGSSHALQYMFVAKGYLTCQHFLFTLKAAGNFFPL